MSERAAHDAANDAAAGRRRILAAHIGHPHRVKLTTPQQQRQSTRVQTISFRAGSRDPGVIRTDDHNPVHVWLEDPGDLPALPVTSRATRSDGSKLSASIPIPSGVDGTRPVERTCPSSQTATTQKSWCTSRPIARPVHLAKGILTSINTVDSQPENQRDNDTDRYELEAQSKQKAVSCFEKDSPKQTTS
ncbi:MAG TPA: hypothetical protein VG293_09605 [Solirubrobacteraceae bacterium]|nr:hypothetical protein [Solirubrobacteraceae bacterium]